MAAPGPAGVAQLEQLAAAEPADAREQRLPVGDGVVDEVMGEGQLVGGGPAAQQRQQHANLGREEQGRPVEDGEERAATELVLGEQATALVAVPQDERERPAQRAPAAREPRRA